MINSGTQPHIGAGTPSKTFDEYKKLILNPDHPKFSYGDFKGELIDKTSFSNFFSSITGKWKGVKIHILYEIYILN